MDDEFWITAVVDNRRLLLLGDLKLYGVCRQLLSQDLFQINASLELSPVQHPRSPLSLLILRESHVLLKRHDALVLAHLQLLLEHLLLLLCFQSQTMLLRLLHL